MEKKRKTWILWIIALVLVALMSGFIGYRIGINEVDSNENNSNEIVHSQTFYAVIDSIDEKTIRVTGMDVNDVNFRGKFTFNVDDTTQITWRYERMELSELEVEDHISITFSGDILETYPASLEDVTWIQLLDDEK